MSSNSVSGAAVLAARESPVVFEGGRGILQTHIGERS